MADEEYGLGPSFDNVLARRIVQEFADEFTGTIDNTRRETLQGRLLGVIRDCKRIGSSFHVEQEDSNEVGTSKEIRISDEKLSHSRT